jgi:AICAR transformylase/IMP cyclohydrolase PurH
MATAKVNTLKSRSIIVDENSGTVGVGVGEAGIELSKT